MLFVIAALLRFVNLGGPDLWLDEVWAYEASNTLIKDLLRWDTLYDPIASPTPSFDVKVSKRVFGVNNFAIRAPSAFWGSAAVVMLYLLIGAARGWRVAFAAALFMALLPFAIDWSREGRMYGAWMFWSVALAALAWDATHRTERGEVNALDWRWWLIGVLFMVIHAANVHAVMTIGGVGLWLGIVALTVLRRDRKAGLQMLLGPALATCVYLSSWALTGIGRIMTAAAGAPADGNQEITLDLFLTHTRKVLTDSTGGLPVGVALLVWAVAVAGLVLLVMRGHWRLVLLVTLLGCINWVAYRSFAGRHLFPPRYVLIMSVTLATGLGAAASSGFDLIRQRFGQNASRAFAAVGLAACVVLWLPGWWVMATVPKQALHSALDPVKQHAQPDDAFTTVEDYYFCIAGYYEVDEKAKLMLPAKESRAWASLIKAKPNNPPEPFDLDFEAFFDQPGRSNDEPSKDDSNTPPQQPPTAIWVFLAEPKRDVNSPGVVRMLKAFGPPGRDARQRLKEAAEDAHTLTFRVSPAGIDHITATPTRPAVWVARVKHILN